MVAPTEHLKTQWAEAAARAGIPIDPSYSAGQGKTSQDYVGIAVTYAGVAVNPLAHRIRTERFKTLVILDEVHHAGDALSWGEGVREAFDPAVRRLALTGTPFRSDVNPIPFVTYAPGDDGVPRSVADFTYGYAHALADHVVRPVLFMAYSGEMQWRTRAGDELAVRLGEPMTKDATSQALRTALDPNGAWIPSVLAAADRRLSEVRRHVPDAGGLVIATDQDSARAYAKILQAISGEKADRGALRREGRVEEDRRVHARPRTAGWSRSGWSPRASTCPRLAVGVYATTTSTPLFFAQAVGRFVRARKRGETASVFLPSVPALLGLASEMEVERDHVLGRKVTDEDDIFAAEQDLLDQANAGEGASDDLLGLVGGARLAGDASTGCSTTAASSATPARCTSAPTRRWTSSASPACSSPTRCATCCTRGSPSGRRSRSRPRPAGRHRRRGEHPRAAGAAAPRAQRAGGRVVPPHRPAARRHPRLAPQGVRRTGRGGRDRRPAPRADRRAPRQGGPQELVSILGSMAAETSQTLDRGLHVLRILAGAPGRSDRHRAGQRRSA